jgi:hypothetical protein
MIEGFDVTFAQDAHRASRRCGQLCQILHTALIRSKVADNMRASYHAHAHIKSIEANVHGKKQGNS